MDSLFLCEPLLFYHMLLQEMQLTKHLTGLKMRPLFSNCSLQRLTLKFFSFFFLIQYSAKNTFAVRLEGSREVNTIIIDNSPTRRSVVIWRN